jgi:hypothetical protein
MEKANVKPMDSGPKCYGGMSHFLQRFSSLKSKPDAVDEQPQVFTILSWLI